MFCVCVCASFLSTTLFSLKEDICERGTKSKKEANEKVEIKLDK